MDAATTNNFEKIMQDVDSLNPDEKAKLLKKLLSDSSIQVTIGSSQFDADNVYQFNLNSTEQIAGILTAIADKLRT